MVEYISSTNKIKNTGKITIVKISLYLKAVIKSPFKMDIKALVEPHVEHKIPALLYNAHNFILLILLGLKEAKTTNKDI